MYLSDELQKTLRRLEKISENEVVKKEGDLFIAVNVLTQSSRILHEDRMLIESMMSTSKHSSKKILKG